ncbi:uncharacterized protein TNCV_1494361 [Trichonephila clavipes]|nr:uncharacterized protein TNCV_1494361 [Trichonephila clavipes]
MKKERLRWEVFDHLPHSSSDFHLFGPLKKHLGTQHFRTDAEVQQAVLTWCHNLDTYFYDAGFDGLGRLRAWANCAPRSWPTMLKALANCVQGLGQLCSRPWPTVPKASATIGALFRSRLCLNKTMIQKISTRFVEWAQNEIAVVPDFHKRILFSDEAHFWLNGYVNKQNCRIWSEADPQVYVETPLHPEKLTVWCALWAGGIIGPYFFKNDEGHNELWFQQDGATCHTARATINLSKDTLGDRLISRFGPVNWPPRSCDLTPLDYFLWGYVKSLVYADKPQTLDHLEDNIRRVSADIRPQMLEKVIENWTSRLDYIRASRGSPMPKII